MVVLSTFKRCENKKLVITYQTDEKLGCILTLASFRNTDVYSLCGPEILFCKIKYAEAKGSM